MDVALVLALWCSVPFVGGDRRLKSGYPGSTGQPSSSASRTDASIITFLIMLDPLCPCGIPRVAAQEETCFNKCQTGSLLAAACFCCFITSTVAPTGLYCSVCEDEYAG